MRKTMVRTRKKAGTRRTPKSERDASGLLLLASAIGHVVQASKNADLQAEQGRIEAILREWQKAYDDLSTRFRDLRGAYERLSRQLEVSEGERRRLTLERLGREGRVSQPKAPAAKSAPRPGEPTP